VVVVTVVVVVVEVEPGGRVVIGSVCDPPVQADVNSETATTRATRGLIEVGL
jgi:hypothetical protein